MQKLSLPRLNSNECAPTETFPRKVTLQLFPGISAGNDHKRPRCQADAVHPKMFLIWYWAFTVNERIQRNKEVAIMLASVTDATDSTGLIFLDGAL